MPLYRLTRSYYDKFGLREKGETLEFPEGAAPKGSVLVDEPAPPKAPKAPPKEIALKELEKPVPDASKETFSEMNKG